MPIAAFYNNLKKCINLPDLSDIIFVIFDLIVCLTGVICHSIFLGLMKYYNMPYNCSDNITNELFKIENKNSNKIILISIINLGADAFLFLFIGLIFLILNRIDKNRDFSVNNNKIEKPKKKISQVMKIQKII